MGKGIDETKKKIEEARKQVDKCIKKCEPHITRIKQQKKYLKADPTMAALKEGLDDACFSLNEQLRGLPRLIGKFETHVKDLEEQAGADDNYVVAAKKAATVYNELEERWRTKLKKWERSGEWEKIDF